MSVTFATDLALPADAVGACPTEDPETGMDSIAVAFQPDGADLQVFALSVCGARHLCAALEAALEVPRSWEGDDDEGDLLDVLEAFEARCHTDVVDLARARSVRWDETWSHSRPR